MKVVHPADRAAQMDRKNLNNVRFDRIKSLINPGQGFRPGMWCRKQERPGTGQPGNKHPDANQEPACEYTLQQFGIGSTVFFLSTKTAALGLFLGFIPILGWLISFAGSVYSLYLAFLAIKQIQVFDNQKAAINVAIGWLIFLVVGFIISGIIVAAVAAATLGLASGFINSL